MPSSASQIPTYVTRVTWNINEWRRPSGAGAKAETGTYVAQNGFGYEEWLNRTEWLLDGWRYSFLQGIHKSRHALAGATVRVLLYTINPLGERLYVGELTSAEIVDSAASKRVTEHSKRRGHLQTMVREIRQAGGDSRKLAPDSTDDLFNVRFRPEALLMYDDPRLAPETDNIWNFSRYAMIEAGERVIAEWKAIQKRKPDAQPRSEVARVYEIARRVIKADATEAKMQNEIRAILEQKYGLEAVEVERDYIDITVSTPGTKLLLEIKAETNARVAIRAALGQLLE